MLAVRMILDNKQGIESKENERLQAESSINIKDYNVVDYLTWLYLTTDYWNYYL